MSAPSRSYWRGPVSPTPALWTSRSVSVFEFNESRLWMVGFQRTVLVCRSLVSLCFSSSTFWKGRCSCFVSFDSHVFFCVLTFLGLQWNSEQGAQRRGRVSVSLNALTAVQMPETRMLGSSWMQHVFFCAGHLFHSVSCLQQSGKVGVLVSMVLILTLFLSSYFSRFTVKLWAGGSDTWTCKYQLERTDGRADARNEDAPLIVDATCFFCAGHLLHSVSRLQHSGKVGVLVSMVLILMFFSVFLFFSVYSETLSRELRDVDVWVLASTHWRPCRCQRRGCSAPHGCNMQTRQPVAHHGRYEPLGHKRCFLHGAS